MTIENDPPPKTPAAQHRDPRLALPSRDEAARLVRDVKLPS